MGEMFWRKLILVNIALFIVMLRIYGLLLARIENYINMPSIFPKEDQNGYPFFEQINCNLRKLLLMTNELVKYKDINNNKIKSINNNNNNNCGFYQRLLICKGNQHCERNFQCRDPLNLNDSKLPMNSSLLYHLYTNYNGILIWNELYELNYFEYNNKEMEFLYKIISGYHAYINLIINDDEIALNDKLTYSYEKLNNLLYLHSLLLKSTIMNDREFLTYSNVFTKDKIVEYSEECLSFSDDYIPLLNNDDKEEIFSIIKNIKDIITCINEPISKIGALIDFNGIEAMFKVLFNQPITQNEKDNIQLLTLQFIKAIDKLFQIDYKVKATSLKYQNYNTYITIIIFGMGITILLFVNSFLLKKREHYDKKNNKGREIKKVNKIKAKNKELTQEELDYINRLSKETKDSKGNNNDFIITK